MNLALSLKREEISPGLYNSAMKCNTPEGGQDINRLEILQNESKS